MSENINDVNTALTSSVDGTTAVDSTTTNPAVVPVENRVAELNRKFAKFERSLDEKFSQLINYVQQGAKQTTASAPKAVDETPIQNILNSNVETIVNQKILQQKHAESYQNVLRSYPELNPESATFDDKFHSKADSYYKALVATNDPEAPLKAVRLAAMDLGKFEQVERERLIADEARRMRTLGDGGGNAHKSAQAQQDKDNLKLKGLAGLLGVDSKSLDIHMRKNAYKYGIKG